MTWQEVCDRKDLRDLPYKIELNQFGQILMSPASNHHGFLQARLSYLLLDHGPEGSRVISECSVDTSDGTKVADVAWLSEKFWKEHGSETPFSEAPELCVEIQSPSNTKAEMKFKRGLYFAAGASEVWVCNEAGELTFFVDGSQASESVLFPTVPPKI
ncbi:MAG: Uma2 family endonuclease [Verrucomicrobiota bacterium]